MTTAPARAGMLAVALWLFVMPPIAVAQDAGTPEAAPDLAEQLTAAQTRNAELEAAFGLLAQKLDQANSALAQKRREAEQARYQHYIDLLEHREEVFAWQLFASYVVLGIVALVTLAGLVFSAAQLYNALKLSTPQSNIDLEISASKVRITSSVVGVVVLTLSIVFLFLFLDRIYDIREIGEAPAAAEPAASEAVRQGPAAHAGYGPSDRTPLELIAGLARPTRAGRPGTARIVASTLSGG